MEKSLGTRNPLVHPFTGRCLSPCRLPDPFVQPDLRLAPDGVLTPAVRAAILYALLGRFAA